MTPQNDRLTELLTAAAAARGRGQPAQEQQFLDEALRVAPDDPRVLNSLGMAALGARDFDLARGFFERAVERDAGAPALWMNLATATRSLGDDAEEAAALEGALAIDRRHFTANLRMAELRERRGEEKEAALSWSAIVQMAAHMVDRPPQIEDAARRGQAFLNSRSAALQSQIDRQLGDRLSALGTGARRFNTAIDQALRGRPIYRNECSGIHYPFLPADEYFERSHFPWMAELEAKTPAIREEALRLMAEGGAAIRPYVKQDSGTPENKWSGLNDSLDWGACFLWEYGIRNDAVCALCPETAAALEKVPQNHAPGKAPTAFFSILKPGAHIPPHTGVTNTRAIVHLPLVVPDGCALRVGGETRAWREGEAFAFDDTIEHEAWNKSGEPRIVLIFDVWNPHLSRDEQELLSDFFALVEQPRDI
jgi:aspartate beta-hydroxylase